MPKYIFTFFLVALLLLATFLLPDVFAKNGAVPAPHPLPHVEQTMNTPGFWISRHPSPNTVLMTPTDIEAFNAFIRDQQKLTRDIFKPQTFLPQLSLNNTFESTVKDLQSKKYLNATNQPAQSAFFKPLLLNMLTDQPFEPQYGLVVRFTNERILPTEQGLYEEPDDKEFDQLQNSGLDLGTAVIILQRSQDGKWVYEMNELTDGWVRAEDIAIGEAKIVQDFAKSSDFVIAIKPKADLFTNSERTQFIGRIRMGARLPFLTKPDISAVQIPTRDDSGKLILTTGFMNDQDIHEGYLAYNARNIFQQAFAMLNQPYGWGDVNGEQDCSRFLQEVFATAGIKLPRNSKEQAQTGKTQAAFDAVTTDPQKQDTLKNLTDSLYLLTLKGHIMMFLGNINGRSYAIHDVYAYREKNSNGDLVHVINRVAVTDLNLGEGSRKGSLLRRLTGIRDIKHQSQNPSIK